MSPIKQTDSGLVIVTSKEEPKPVPKERKWGKIEIQDDEVRRQLSRLLAQIAEDSGKQGGIKLPGGVGYNIVREYVVREFAYQILGDDWSYEVKC
jgi:hypothetical protein